MEGGVYRERESFSAVNGRPPGLCAKSPDIVAPVRAIRSYLGNRRASEQQQLRQVQHFKRLASGLQSFHTLKKNTVVSQQQGAGLVRDQTRGLAGRIISPHVG